MPVRILLIAPVFSPAVGFGGPVVFSKTLFDDLAQREDVDIEVMTSTWGMRGAPIDGSAGDGGRVRVCGYCLVRDFSLEMLFRLPGAIRRSNILQIHSLFSATSLIALFAARWFRKPVVLVPHGQLLNYGLGRRTWLKRPWLSVIRFLGLSDRTVVRATSREESIRNQEALRDFAHIMIASGVAVPARLAPAPSRKRLLFLGRLDAVKQLEILLEAMRRLPTEITLDVHGEGEATYTASLRALSIELGVSDRVTFHGWSEADAMKQAFSEASALVVPSRSENFGQVVIEALAHGLPVVASQGTPWAELDQRECGRWVPANPESIAVACREVLEFDPAAVRRRARRWMREAYSNDAITAKFVSLYNDLLELDPGPGPGVELRPKLRSRRRPAKICIVSSCGGHLAEIRALAQAYGTLPHIYVLNDWIELPAELIGRTNFIKHSERDPWFLWNLWELFRILRRERPDILLSSGAGPIVPAAIVGRFFFGCRVIYIETMTRMRVPSLTGRIMYRLAHRFVYQWPDLKRYFPKGTHAGPFQ